MASLSTPGDEASEIYYEEPPRKAPPLLEIGVVAWARENLFRSWLDAVLTVLSSLVIITVVTSLFQWSVNWANWYAILFNVRQFMVGRYESDAEWRVQLLALLVAFLVGVCLAAWARLPRFLVMLTVVVLALTFILPLVIDVTIPFPPSYLTAGNVAIASGSVTQTPQTQLAFIGRNDERVVLRLALDAGAADEALALVHGFSDNAANTLRNAAGNRLSNQARIAEIERLLQGESLTARQRDRLAEEQGKLEVPPPVTETYALNQTPINVRILRGDTLEPLGEATLSADSPSLEIVLPEDGWYILEKTVPEGNGTALLQVEGIYPLQERSLTRSTENTDTAAQVGRVSQFVRMTDEFTTEAARPQIDGADVPMALMIENQYRGEKPFPDYLRLFLARFLQQINGPLLLILLAVVAGQVGGRLADRFYSPREMPRRAAQRMALWLLVAAPFVMFVLALGFGSVLPVTDTRRWGGLLLTTILTVVGIIGSFPIGVLLALGRRSQLPVVRIACTLFIEVVRGVPLITVLFMSMLILPLANPALGGPDTQVYRAMVAIVLFSGAYLAENVRGGLQSIPHGQEEAARAVGLQGWQITLYITLPQALRIVIPALVGQFISLFKDTSLVAVVGLIDLTGIANSVVAQSEFIGTRRETYVYISIIYFVFSYVMSFVARRLEQSGVGVARRF